MEPFRSFVDLLFYEWMQEPKPEDEDDVRPENNTKVS
jgi:hypothetical protein